MALPVPTSRVPAPRNGPWSAPGGGHVSGHRRAPASRPFSALRRSWNGIKTAVLLAGLGGLLVVLGAQFGRGGAVVGLVLGLGAVAGSYWYSDRLALMAARAVPVGPDDFPTYHRIVRELTTEAGLPMPRLYVTPDAQPNAFATGRNPRHAAVAVTRGLLELLDARELRAVLAHELAHVGNRDILITSVAAALATGISFLANLVGMLPFFGSSEDDEDPGPLATMVVLLVAPVAAALLQLALSRSREFEADRTGADLVGDGSALAGALARIDRVTRRIPMRVEPTQAPKYLVHPLAGRGAMTALFMTHPPVEQRIARLLDLR
jgi:heat shock protein HtpX